MNRKKPEWPEGLKEDIKRGITPKWPQNWSNQSNQCIQCNHPFSEHRIKGGGDGINRVFCISCPPARTILMGDEGLYGPSPYFIEGPLETVPCFKESSASRRVDNFLPLSPSSQGLTTFTLRAKTPDGKEDDSITFTGLSWHPDEFERLKDGDKVHKSSNRYKLHLYWLQEGRCAGCLRVAYFDHMELDRIVPGNAGPGYTVGNTQLLCSSCNKIKSNRSMEYLMKKLRIRGLPQGSDQTDASDGRLT